MRGVGGVCSVGGGVCGCMCRAQYKVEAWYKHCKTPYIAESRGFVKMHRDVPCRGILRPHSSINNNTAGAAAMRGAIRGTWSLSSVLRSPSGTAGQT